MNTSSQKFIDSQRLKDDPFKHFDIPYNDDAAFLEKYHKLMDKIVNDPLYGDQDKSKTFRKILLEDRNELNNWLEILINNRIKNPIEGLLNNNPDTSKENLKSTIEITLVDKEKWNSEFLDRTLDEVIEKAIDAKIAQGQRKPSSTKPLPVQQTITPEIEPSESVTAPVKDENVPILSLIYDEIDWGKGLKISATKNLQPQDEFILVRATRPEHNVIQVKKLFDTLPGDQVARYSANIKKIDLEQHALPNKQQRDALYLFCYSAAKNIYYCNNRILRIIKKSEVDPHPEKCKILWRLEKGAIFDEIILKIEYINPSSFNGAITLKYNNNVLLTLPNANNPWPSRNGIVDYAIKINLGTDIDDVLNYSQVITKNPPMANSITIQRQSN